MNVTTNLETIVEDIFLKRKNDYTFFILMKKLILGFLAIFIFISSLYCEQVYDSSGNLIRSSQWLQRTPPKKQAAPQTVVEVTEEENQKDEEPLNPEQQPMRTVNQVADKVYSQDEIQKTASNNLPDFLQEKGFLIMSAGGSGTKTELSYKGFTAFCIKVYVDGILANNAATGEFDWNSIDINSIESIVISEVPPVGISEFAGCCLFITTKGNQHTFLQTETAFSSYESNFMDGLYQTFNYGASKDKFYYRIGALVALYENEYNKEKAGDISLINKYNFSRMGNASFNWNYAINQNQKLSGAHSFAYNEVKAFGTSDSLATGIEEDTTSQNNITYTYEKDDLRAQTIASYFYGQVDYLKEFKPSGSYFDKTKIQNFAIRQNLSWTVDLSAGYRQEHLFTAEGDRHQIDVGFSKRIPWGRFSFTPCIQILAFSQKNGWHFEALPRLTLSFNDYLTLAAYRTFTLPTFNQLYYPMAGNPELVPEQGWTCTLSYNDKRFPVYGRFTYSYYENKIRWGFGPVAMNVGNADYYVAALGYEQSFWDNHINIQADGTMTQARLRDTHKQIMWVPEWQIHANAGFSYNDFTALVDYSWTSWRYKENSNETFYPDFHMLDVNLGYQINPEFQIYGKVTNLLDQRVEYHDSYYIPSRKWTVGLKIRK